MSDFYCEQVLSGKTEVDVVRESTGTLAFFHTRPAYPVHIVVIPKRHIASLVTLTDQDDALTLELLAAVREVAAKVLRDHGKCRVITNLGDYQDSKHLHFHVVSGKMLETNG